MAVGDIGLGEAFVIDFSGLNQNLNRQTAVLQEQADRRYREVQTQNAQLAEILSKVNLNGVRRADQPEILQAYRNLREQAINAQSINDPYRKSVAIAEVRNGFSDIMAAAEASKQADQFFAGVGQEISKNPAVYADDVVKQFNDDFNKPLSKLSVDSLNPTRYQRRIDDSKVFDDLTSGLQGLLKNQRGNIKVGETVNIGNQRATVVDTVSELPLNSAADYILKKAEADPATSAYLRRTFPDMNEGEAAVNLAQQLSQMGQLSRVQTDVRNNARPRQSGGNSATQNANTYRQQQITGLLSGEQWAIDDLLGAIPSGVNTSERPTVDYNQQNGTITIHAPIGLNRSFNVRNAVTETINVNDGSAVAQLNRVLSDVTGQNVSLGNARIQGGRPRGGLNNLNPNQNSVNSQRQQFRGVPQGGF